MKIKHLLLGMLAMAATVACNQEEPVVTPELDLNKTTASVGAEGGSVALEVTSNVDWTASADQDWVSVDPASGKGSKDAAKVTVSVEPNESEEARTATVTVAAEKLTKTLKITQAGVTSQEPEPEPEPEVAWSMMGCFVDNQWASDVPMTKEGEWIVAKGAQFTELTFKIRGNASWDDATNIGYAPGRRRDL
ncbi:MAG: BACON domain-containing protein [Bacteroidales bacterium]|nr:BACON domain-containing protein [Bacteroidales bacterium]